jgi:hypothetical protein
MADYTIDISMSDDTVAKLLGQGFSLFAFKAVDSSNTGGVPLVWFKTQNFATDTLVEWKVDYEAYTSLTAIVPKGKITASNHYGIDLGQRLVVMGDTGTGNVDKNGVPKAISILNQSPKHKPMTCGIAQLVGGSATPMCAFPLNGTGLDVIAPIEKVFLMFATNKVDTGTVIEQSFGQGILIDLTAANERQVTYDIDAGWGWDGGVWATTYPASTEMVPFLIESSDAIKAATQTLLDATAA